MCVQQTGNMWPDMDTRQRVNSTDAFKKDAFFLEGWGIFPFDKTHSQCKLSPFYLYIGKKTAFTIVLFAIPCRISFTWLHLCSWLESMSLDSYNLSLCATVPACLSVCLWPSVGGHSANAGGRWKGFCFRRAAISIGQWKEPLNIWMHVVLHWFAASLKTIFSFSTMFQSLNLLRRCKNSIAAKRTNITTISHRHFQGSTAKPTASESHLGLGWQWARAHREGYYTAHPTKTPPTDTHTDGLIPFSHGFTTLFLSDTFLGITDSVRNHVKSKCRIFPIRRIIITWKVEIGHY